MRFGTRFDITIHLFLGNYDSGNPSNFFFEFLHIFFFDFGPHLITSKRRRKNDWNNPTAFFRLHVSDFMFEIKSKQFYWF